MRLSTLSIIGAALMSAGPAIGQDSVSLIAAGSLRAALGEGVVGLVHGQMPPAEKDAAMARFSELGLPNQQAEDWKYSNLSPLAKFDFTGPARKAADVVRDEVAQRFPKESAAGRLVFINGMLDTGLSNRIDPGDGVRIVDLASALTEDRRKIAGLGVLAGAGVGAMHMTGMSAIENCLASYDPALLGAGLVLGCASFALALLQRGKRIHRHVLKGLGIVGVNGVLNRHGIDNTANQ